MILASTVTCPICGTAKVETMPTDVCQFFYECTGCSDCCVISRGIVACSAPTGRFRVHLSSKRARVASRQVRACCKPGEFRTWIF